jgi:hypothetical protein
VSAGGVPRRVRREGAWIGKRVTTWVVEDGASRRVTSELSEEELGLPIGAIWNHQYLLGKIRTAWRPELEGRREQAPTGVSGAQTVAKPLQAKPAVGDCDAIAALMATTGGGRQLTIEHYLYVGSLKAARQMTSGVAKRGFEAEIRRGVKGNWLVLARQQVIPSEKAIAAARESLEALAEERGGEYDGWQVALPAGAPA